MAADPEVIYVVSDRVPLLVAGGDAIFTATLKPVEEHEEIEEPEVERLTPELVRRLSVPRTYDRPLDFRPRKLDPIDDVAIEDFVDSEEDDDDGLEEILYDCDYPPCLPPGRVPDFWYCASPLKNPDMFLYYSVSIEQYRDIEAEFECARVARNKSRRDSIERLRSPRKRIIRTGASSPDVPIPLETSMEDEKVVQVEPKSTKRSKTSRRTKKAKDATRDKSAKALARDMSAKASTRDRSAKTSARDKSAKTLARVKSAKASTRNKSAKPLTRDKSAKVTTRDKSAKATVSTAQDKSSKAGKNSKTTRAMKSDKKVEEKGSLRTSLPAPPKGPVPKKMSKKNIRAAKKMKDLPPPLETLTEGLEDPDADENAVTDDQAIHSDDGTGAASPEILEVIFTPTRYRNWETDIFYKRSFETWAEFALRRFRDVLTDHEQKEILGYDDDVYYVGGKADKIKPLRGENHGYDYNGVYEGAVLRDHILYRYEIKSVISRGHAAQVFKCMDHMTGDTVVMKICNNHRKFRKLVLHEIAMLKYVHSMETAVEHAVVPIQRYFKYRQHVCMVFEMLGPNLYQVLKDNSFQGLPESIIREISIGILEAVKFLNRLGVVHTDLKPENIILKEGATIEARIVNFAVSCFRGYVPHCNTQSRYYRAPEVLLRLNYGSEIDMWSVGCIIAEMMNGTPLFDGVDEYDTLALQIECLGTPPIKMQRPSQVHKEHFPKDYVPYYQWDYGERRFAIHEIVTVPGRRQIGLPGSKPIASQMAGCGEVFINFLNNILAMDPAQRMSATEALRHPWIRGMNELAVKKRCPGRHITLPSIPQPPRLRHSSTLMNELRDLIPKVGGDDPNYLPKLTQEVKSKESEKGKKKRTGSVCKKGKSTSLPPIEPKPKKR